MKSEDIWVHTSIIPIHAGVLVHLITVVREGANMRVYHFRDFPRFYRYGMRSVDLGRLNPNHFDLIPFADTAIHSEVFSRALLVLPKPRLKCCQWRPSSFFLWGPITKYFAGAPSIYVFGALETIGPQVVLTSEANLNQPGVGWSPEN